MSGILEKLVHELVQQAVTQIVPQLIQQAMGGPNGGGQMNAAPAQNYAPQVQQQGGADPFAGLGGAPQQQVQQQVTPEMVQALVIPLVSNDQTKARLTAEMQAMGIVNLGDARPDQLPELYQRFQRVAAEAQGVQGQQQAAVNNAGGGII